MGERPSPDAPHPGKRRPHRAPSCHPDSAQSKLARARAVGLVTGPRARTRRTHSQWVVGPACTPERTSGQVWGSARPRAPRTQARPPPPERPRAAPTACQASAQGQLPSPASTPWGARSPKPGRRKRDRATPPPKQAKQSTGPRPDTRRGTQRVEQPYQHPAPAPREVHAPHQPGKGGGGGANAARARAHTQTKDTRGKPEGQPDRARGTHRPHGVAYQRARRRGTKTGRPATHSAGNAGLAGENREDTTSGIGPNPPEPAASAAHTQPGHCTCQGSSGA